LKTFDFKITADTSEITKQFENGAKAVRELALQAEKAEDKLEVLQETSNYIKQMDAALAKVKKKYPNLFQEIFGNVNKQINESLAPLKKMPEEMTKIFGKTKVKLDTLIANPTAATVSDIQEIGNAFKLLAKTMGDTSLDFKFLDGASKNETKIKKLTAAMKELEQSYFNVGAAANTVGGEIKAPKVKTSKQQKGPNIPKVDNLIKSYLQLENTIIRAKQAMDSDNDKAFDKEFDLLEKSFNFDNDMAAEITGILLDTEDSIETIVERIKKKLNVELPFVFSIDDIENAIQRFIDIQNKLDTAKTNEEFNQLLNASDRIENGFNKISDASEEIFAKLGEGDLTKDNAINQLANILGVQVPQAAMSGAQQVENAYKNVENSVKKTSEVIKEVIADTNDVEKLMLLNTKNETASNYIGGNHTGVSPSKLIENYDGGKGFDATLHTHPNNVATPSSWDPISKTSDFNVWIQNFEQFKKHFILAGEQLAEVDFSSLTREQLENLHKIYQAKANEIVEPNDIKINDAISLTYDMIPNIINQMKSNLESTLLQNQNGNDPAIKDVVQSYTQRIIKFFQDVDVGNLSYAEIEERFDQVATDILKQYPEDMRKKIKSTLSNSAFEAFGNVTGIEQSISDQYQQLLQNAFINSIKDADLDSSKVFKLYDAKSFDFDTFTGKQLEIQDSSAALESATSDANELRTALEGAGQETRDLKAEAEAAKKAFSALTAEIQSAAISGSMTDIDIGKNTEGLESAYNHLKKLAEQGTITAEEMEQVEAAYKEANQNLKTAYDSNERGGSIKYIEYQNRIDEELSLARKEVESLEDQLDDLNSSLSIKAVDTKEAFSALTTEIGENWYQMSDVDIGRSEKGLEDARNQLKELAEQGFITAEAMDKFESEYSEAMHQLDMRKTSNKYDREAAQDALKYGGYEDGYQDGYNNARNDYHEELDEYQNTIKKLREELNEASQKASSTGGQISTSFDEESDSVKTNVQEEINQLERLEKKIFEVKHAVEQKIQAFVNERKAVDSNVIKEIAALDNLIKKLKEVKDAVDGKTDAFKQEEGVVKDSVKKATRKKKESDSKKQETTDEPKKQESTDNSSKEITEAEKQAAAEKKENEEKEKQIALNNELIKQEGTLNYLEKEAKKSAKIISNTWNDGQAEEYEQLLVLIQKYKKSKELLSEQELADIKRIISGYQEQAKTIKETAEANKKAKKDAAEAQKKAKNAFGAKEITSASGRMDDAEAYGRQFNQSAKVQDQLEKVRQVYNQLKIEQEKLANSTEAVTQEQENAFKDLVNAFGREFGNLKAIISDSEKAVKNSKFKPVDVDPSTVADMNKLKAAMQQAILSSEQGKVKFGKFNEELNVMEYRVQEAAGKWVHFTAQLDATGTKIIGTNSKLKKTTALWRELADTISSKFKSAIGNITGYDLLYRIINEVKRGITYVREIDSAMTELKKVTNETEETYARFLQTASKTADRIGSTVKDVTTMTADWSRLKYLGLLYGDI